jgi:branched-subunit amino acid permease
VENLDPISADDQLRNERILERLLSAATSMTGICVGLLGAVNAFSRSQKIDTFADDILALNALLFLICCYLIVWALRTASRRRTQQLLYGTEYLFLAAMTLLVMVGFFTVYSIL